MTVEDLKKLSNKYNASNMTEKEKVDYLGNLVNSGVITKEAARGIYNSHYIVEFDPNSRGELTKGEIVNLSQRN